MLHSPCVYWMGKNLLPPFLPRIPSSSFRDDDDDEHLSEEVLFRVITWACTSYTHTHTRTQPSSGQPGCDKMSCWATTTTRPSSCSSSFFMEVREGERRKKRKFLSLSPPPPTSNFLLSRLLLPCFFILLLMYQQSKSLVPQLKRPDLQNTRYFGDTVDEWFSTKLLILSPIYNSLTNWWCINIILSNIFPCSVVSDESSNSKS